MIKKQDSQQRSIELVSIDDLVPHNHLLRKIDKYISFHFIHDKVKHYYSLDQGRPATDPTMFFKMLFIGYLFGVRSERQLIEEIKVNVAYRWFLGLGLTDKVPDHSWLSKNRDRFKDSDIYQEIFEAIVFQAISRKLVDGRTLYTDSTHLKANANKNKFIKKEVAKSTRSYLADLEDAINKDREEHGKKPLKKKDDDNDTKKETKVSTTDPDSGYMVRDNKPKGFFYLDHRTVDGKYSIITDTYVTAGNVHDSIPYLNRLDHQRERFSFNVKSVGLDAGYFTAPICKGLLDRDIYGTIAYRRPNHRKGFLRKREFIYNPKEDTYLCPGGQKLQYRNTTRDGYKEYVSSPDICKSCEYLNRCTTSRENKKVVTRHVWEEHKEIINSHRLEDKGKKIYKRRKETVERSFADSKQLHGHRYAKLRGINKVREQCLMAAVCQNMKKIAMILFGRYFLLIRGSFEPMELLKRYVKEFQGNYPKIVFSVN